MLFCDSGAQLMSVGSSKREQLPLLIEHDGRLGQALRNI